MITFRLKTLQAMPRKLESMLKYECNKAQSNC